MRSRARAEITLRDRLAFIPNTVNGDDTPSLRKPGDHDSMIVRIGSFEFIKKLAHRAIARHRLIKFYAEFHSLATSKLMYPHFLQ